MERPWVPEAPQMHVIVVEVTDAEGETGVGFSWTPTIGPEAVQALLDHDIAPFITSRSTDPHQLWDPLWAHLHEAGGGGLTTIAMAGVDLALWDLRARKAGTGVTELLGRRHQTLRTYGSGVNLHYSLEELGEQLHRWVAAGHTAVKMKVGSAQLERDVERVQLAREIIGPDRALMIDANQRWSLEAAERAVAALADYDLEWIEEPLRADDTLGYVELARRISQTGPRVPIAAGENFHTLHRFREIVAAGGAQILQPNIVRVGGLTPFLRIAELVRTKGLRLAPHLLPDLSGQIAATLQEQAWVEDVEDADLHALGFLTQPSPVRMGRGELRLEPALGLGLTFA